MPNSHPWLGSFYMAVGVFFFVCVNAVIKAMDHSYPSETILFFRFSFATLPCIFYMLMRGQINLIIAKNIKIHALRGALGLVSLFFLFESIRLLPLSEAVTISFISAVFVTLFALIFLKESCSLRQWFYLALGFSGVLLIAQPDKSSLKLGVLYGLGSAAIEGGMIIHTRFLSRQHHPVQIAFYYALFAALFCTPFLIQSWNPISTHDLFFLSLVGIGGGTGQIFLFKAAQHAPGSKLAPMIYTQIIWSLLFDWTFFHANISTTAFVGMGLIIFSGIASTLKQAQIEMSP